MLPAIRPTLIPGTCLTSVYSCRSLCPHLSQLPTYFLWSDIFVGFFSPSSPCVSGWKKTSQQSGHLHIHGLMCSALCIYILLPSFLATGLTSCVSLWCESELIFKSVDTGLLDSIGRDRISQVWLVERKSTGLGVNSPNSVSRWVSSQLCGLTDVTHSL